MAISKNTLGLAAEFAVASELCRRNVYAQLTLGRQKRTDLLIFTENRELLRIEVKGKQGRTWPNCKGIYGDNVFLVFVDFEKKNKLGRPDFYMLSVDDWINIANSAIEKELAKHPDADIELNRFNVPVYKSQLLKSGKPYKGHSVTVKEVQKYKEQWEKITNTVLRSP